MTVWFIYKMAFFRQHHLFFGRALTENIETTVIIWIYLQSFLNYSKLK